MSEYWQTILMAMAPLGELRVALPYALTKLSLPFWEAYFLSVVGNMIPIIIIIYLLDPVSKFLSKHSRLFKRFFDWLFERTRKKHSHRFEVLEEIALVSFVAIPLPVTGAWSGAVAAFVFGIPPKKSLLLILLGVMIAGIVVGLLTIGIKFLV